MKPKITGWKWHQLDHTQMSQHIITQFFTGRMQPTNSVKALKANVMHI